MRKLEELGQYHILAQTGCSVERVTSTLYAHPGGPEADAPYLRSGRTFERIGHPRPFRTSRLG
jgi:hypothetical protein